MRYTLYSANTPEGRVRATSGAAIAPTQEVAVAVVQMRKSDKSGVEIPDGTGARVRVMFADEEKVDLRADLTDEEVAELLPFAEPVQTRPDRRAPKR